MGAVLSVFNHEMKHSATFGRNRKRFLALKGKTTLGNIDDTRLEAVLTLCLGSHFQRKVAVEALKLTLVDAPAHKEDCHQETEGVNEHPHNDDDQTESTIDDELLYRKEQRDQRDHQETNMRNRKIKLVVVIPRSRLCRNRKLLLIDMEELCPDRNQKIREHNRINRIAPACVSDFRADLLQQITVADVIWQPNENQLL